MIVTDVELYLADVHLPRACCTREPGQYAVHVWRRGGAYRKARRLLRKVEALRVRVVLPVKGALPAMRLFGMEVRIHAAIDMDGVYMIDGRRIVAGRRAFAEEARPRPASRDLAKRGEGEP